MEITLHFCQWTRRLAIQTNKTYREQFTTRLMATLDNIEEEAQRASDEVWESSMRSPIRGDYDDDPSIYAEAANDFGLEVYENLKFTRQQLMGLSIAGLYHLWEKTLKQFLTKEFKFYRLEKKAFEYLDKADFMRLTKILMEFGVDISAQPTYKKLNELRLIANTIKHGQGQSFDELADSAPHLFNSVLKEFGYPPIPDDIDLTRSHFESYAATIEQFWIAFPENLKCVTPKVTPH